LDLYRRLLLDPVAVCIRPRGCCQKDRLRGSSKLELLVEG
jgi:hypothetical protein